MRGLVAGLPSPRPLGDGLPALYREDDLARRLTIGFDDALGPVFSTLDNLDAYVDPWLTPEDFLDWLAGWVGAVIDETWDVPRRRAAVAQAVDLYRRRGTALGLASGVELVTGGEVEIIENGATAWSADPGGPLPGDPEPTLTVRVRIPDPGTVDVVRLDLLVAAAKPAHVPHAIEIVHVVAESTT